MLTFTIMLHTRLQIGYNPSETLREYVVILNNSCKDIDFF